MSSTNTFFTHLHCSQCGKTFPPDRVHSYCPDCSKSLLADYDLEKARSALSREMISRREGSLWRYRELLPVVHEENIVTLGEGWTPLLTASKLAHDLGLEELLIKEEGYNPTGSFKARGLCLAVSKAKELGIREGAMPSAGNAGGAFAAYAARAGMKAHVFVPKETPAVNIKEISLFGGNVTLVDGVISDAGKKMNEVKGRNNWFDMSTMKEPYRLEGKKTMGYEIAEQLNWTLPDVILYPTGGGTGLIGMWKAFNELEALGWIDNRRPKMVSVQAAGCAPIVKAFHDGKRVSEFWNGSATKASGLRVPKAFADHLILDALYESKGTAIAVPDAELLAEMKNVARMEGIFLCPEGAAAVAAVRRLASVNYITSNDKVVIFNTGTGYKYTELYLE